MSISSTPPPLPDDMATSLGHAVSAFGFLEEALKRAIFSLTRQGLGEDAKEKELEEWLARMEDIADDSLGTLIDSFLASIKPLEMKNKDKLGDALRDIRLKRNLLCHASWRPGEKPGFWQPTFINTKGERYPAELNSADIDEIHAACLQLAKQVIQIMRATGIEGELAVDDDDT